MNKGGRCEDPEDRQAGSGGRRPRNEQLRLGHAVDEVGSVVGAAMEEGINLFDTSDSYGESEERLARALGKRRDEVVIATKFGDQVGGEKGTGGASPEYVRRALEASFGVWRLTGSTCTRSTGQTPRRQSVTPWPSWTRR